MAKKAVFLDRDGTIIPETGAVTADPDVEPLEEAVEAIRKLRAAGFLLVVVTNQSGVARGYYTEKELAAMHDALLHKFAEREASIDAVYYCPHLPEGTVAEYAVACECRKPKPGLLLRAAKELDIDLGRSYGVGDTPRDVEAARAAGCKGAALIVPDHAETFRLDYASAPEWKQIAEDMDAAARTGADVVAPDVAAAAEWILEVEREGDG